MEGSEFAFDGVDLLHYKYNKISLNRGGSHVDSLESLKNKKATINPKNNGDKCFQYAVKVALSHENIVKDLQRMTPVTPFTNQYNFKEITFPSHKKDLKITFLFKLFTFI